MIYLDSNIFLYAALNIGPKGRWCESVLRRVQQGDEQGGRAPSPSTRFCTR